MGEKEAKKKVASTLAYQRTVGANNRLAELEQENNRLLGKIADLENKLKEISKRFEPQSFIDVMNEVEENYRNKEQLKQAKKIIKECLRNMQDDTGDMKPIIEQAEQFLEEDK